MGGISGLYTALSSLHSQRQGLEVTGHNVANANTAGYTRQRVNLAAAGGQVVPGIHSRWNGVTGGVRVQAIDRLRDDFLEARAIQEHGTDAALRRSQSVMSRIELAFPEPGDAGIQSLLADLWAGWGDIANRPDDLAARSQLVERARTLASGFNQASADLGALWESSAEQLNIAVAGINATAARVADLNGAIERATKAGLMPNDLFDQRDLLLLDLARAGGVTVRQTDAGMVDVFVSGTALVRGSVAERLEVVRPTGTDIASAASQPVGVRWAKDGYPATIGGGDVGGLLDGLNGALPTYRARLDAVAEQLAARVNTQQASGVDADGNPGAAIFTWSAGGLDMTITDPRALAAGIAGSGPLDGANAMAMARIGKEPDGPDASYRTFIIGLGVDVQAVDRRVDIQATITSQVDASREAVSGVSLDEEMANMVAYQHAFEAASRFLTSVDQLLETLINRTGLVGR